MKNAFLVGDQTYLRSLATEDVDSLLKWSNDIEIKKYFDSPKPHNREQIEIMLKGAGNQILLGIVAKAEDRLIGYTQLSNINYIDSNAMYAVLIGEKDYWGHGLGTEITRLMVDYAFNILNLNKVWLNVNAPNAGAVRAYEKAGFTREGVKREDKYFDGRFHDTIFMGVLKKEWKRKRPRRSPGK